MYRNFASLFLFCASVVLAPLPANGDLVNWNTDGAYMENLGNTYASGFQSLFDVYSPVGPDYFAPNSNVLGQPITDSDKVTLGADMGSLTLVPGVPQIVAINPLTFDVGWTGDMNEGDTKTNDYNLTRNMTVNGITLSLVNPMTHFVSYYYDSLQVKAGSPVAFGNITVTPLGWGAPFENEGGAMATSPVYAEFLVSAVPEPGSFLLVFAATGAAGLIAIARRCLA